MPPLTHFDNFFTVGMYAISFILGAILVIITNFQKLISKFREFNRPKIERTFVRIHSQLDEMLTELRLTLNSCRTGIVKFHNGGHFFDGTSILKFTTTHESCEIGIDSSIDSPQGQLITRYVDKIKILDKDEIKIYYTSDLKDSYFKGYLEQRSTVAFILLPLFCEKGLKIGYLISEWCDHERIESRSLEDVVDGTKYYRRIINSILITNKTNE
jgi:hypothetical protein